MLRSAFDEDSRIGCDVAMREVGATAGGMSGSFEASMD
jgi:hypothetical protein